MENKEIGLGGIYKIEYDGKIAPAKVLQLGRGVKDDGHTVEIMNGPNKGTRTKVISRRFRSVWSADDESHFVPLWEQQDLQRFQSQVLTAERTKNQEEARDRAAEVVMMLEVLGINAGVGSLRPQTHDEDGRNINNWTQYTASVIVQNADKLKALIDDAYVKRLIGGA